MVNVLTTAQTLAEDLSALGSWIGVCTGPPGNSDVVNNEAAGGSPPYGRVETIWTQGTNGVVTGSVIVLNLPAGTYPYLIMCSQSSGNNMVDWCILPQPIQLGSQQSVQITPTVTVS